MVSGFLCPCHGPLQLTDKQLQENLHIKDKDAYVLHSVQADGYWTSEHMIEQVWLNFFFIIKKKNFQILNQLTFTFII